MSLKKYIFNHITTIFLLTIVGSTLLFTSTVFAQTDSLKFPINDTGASEEEEYNPFDLKPTDVEQKVEYDPKTGQYVLTETIGGITYQRPTTLSFIDYWKYRDRQVINNYWNQKSNSQSLLQGQGKTPPLFQSEVSLGPFGSNKVDIRPTGNIDLVFGFQNQTVENPTLPLRAQNPGPTFLFDMGIDMGVTGNIGEKLRLETKYNTKSVFDFDNQIKLEYIGDEDEIIQEIRAGNVNFNLPVTLIPGAQNLFGIQTKLKFGRLTVNTVLSQQRSRARNITLQNGGQIKEFEVSSYEYDDNRHFFLAQYFRNNFEEWVATRPYIQSPITITRLDVYVSDNRGTPEDTQRDITALADLGEITPFNTNTTVSSVQESSPLPRNEINNLKRILDTDENNSARNLALVISTLETQYQLQDVRDFRQTRARRLNQSEYTFDPQLGFVSINFRLNPNEVVGVAYEYVDARTGEKHQVGEFAEDIFPVDSLQAPRIAFLKMLKSTSLIPNHPLFDLMMKNIYSLGTFQLEQQDFKLDIYYENAGGGELRYIPEGENLRGNPLIQVLGLDRLNAVNQPQSDGIFDFLPAAQNNSTRATGSNSTGGGGRGGGRGFGGSSSNAQASATNAYRYGTINVRNGRIIFPVLEPFGKNLQEQFTEQEVELASQYTYQVIYDSTKTIALEYPEKNRFWIRGTYKETVSSEIPLGAFNIPPGSVRVTAGGRVLTEGSDYTVDYNLGRVRILNDAYLQAGIPINVAFEDSGIFGLQQKTYIGARLDYQVSRDINIGGTFVRLSERPFTQKVNYGEDPIANSMVGLDMNYFTEAPWITKMVDKLPFLDTKEPSSITFNAEVAGLLPGHSRAIDGDNNGTAYIDDFEGSNNTFDLRFPYNAWKLASTPKGTIDEFGVPLFQEANLSNDLAYNFNRAKMAWYQIDFFFNPQNGQLDETLQIEAETNQYARLIPQVEVFPNLQSSILSNTQANTVTFDMAYYPDERGQYNFETEGSDYSAGLEADGKLKDPETRWGGIMRNCPYKDFEQANVEFVEFWLMDPLIYNRDNDGYLYLNLGNVSEDVLKDGRAFYENGLNETVSLDSTTVWGVAPRIPPLINGFSNEIDIRQEQDIGFDGLNNTGETEEFKDYVNYIQNLRNTTSDTETQERLDQILADPSGDDFLFFRDVSYDQMNSTILERYKAFNGAEGNSPVQTDSINFTNAATNLPEAEDLDNDRSLERAEAYLQYRIHLKSFQDMQIGEDYLADYIDARVDYEDRTDTTVRWYYFRIPVEDYTEKIGSVDLRNIEGIRMFMTGFEDPVVCRFARFNLVRSNWRRYDPVLREEGEYLPNDNETDSYFNIATVSLEQNSDRSAIPYIIPPGIQRENITNAQFNVLQNEQAISIEVGRLKDGEARGIYKTIDMDMRVFKNLKMFIHAKSDTSRDCFPIEDDEVTAFIRLGDDFQQNYYEYEVPLKVTQLKASDDTLAYTQRDIWPEENDIDVPLQELVKLKLERNSQRRINPNLPVNKPFIRYIDADSLIVGKRRRRVSVVGSPDLGRVKQVMLGVRNPKRTSLTERDAIPDDAASVCATVWFNELRLTDFDEGAGFAGLARMDVKLADFGSMTFSGNAHTNGFGQIEQRVHERLRDNYVEYNASTNLELGRLLPKNSGVRIPMYAGITRTVSTPEYDPYDTDIIFNEQMDSIRAVEERRNPGEANAVVKEERKKRQTASTIKSLNFTNVRKERTNPERKPKVWDVENLDLTYAYTKTENRDPIIKSADETRHFAALGYKYNTRPKSIYPFRKMIQSKSKYLSLLKDFNINPIPNRIGFQTDIERFKQKVQLRRLGAEEFDPNPIWNKYIFWNRRYNFDYQPTKSINFTFNANNQSVIDELAGDPGSDENKQRIRDGIRDLGRTTLYDQSASLSYNLPLNKIPFLDWTTVRTSYGSTYKWQGNPVTSFDDPSNTGIASEIGNNIYNSQDIQINAELSFSKLYNKVPLFKKATSSRSNRKKPRGRKPKDKKAEAPDAANKKNKRAAGDISPITKILLQPLLMLKRVSLNYNDRKSTVIPGFNHESQYIGQNWDVNAPGFDFIFGWQPDDPWLERAAENDWLTKSNRLYDPVIRSKDKSLRVTTRLEPFKDLRVDVNMNLNYNKTNRQFFAANDITDKNTRAYQHLPLQDEGGFSISYVAFNTLYDEIDTSNISSTFKRFESYRGDISRRWQGLNPNSEGDFEQNGSVNADYAFGYGPISPDVLAPAFVAAYAGRNPETMNLNILNHFPLPNWRVTYNGLNKLPLFKSLFSSINLSHAYNSTLNINNFRQDLDFTVDRRNPEVTNDGRLVDYIVGENIAIPTTIDTITGNYFTHYIIPNISISEQFAPMFGIDATWVNGLSTRFEYKTARALGMSFIDYQLSEQRSEEFVIGLGYTFQNGFKLPFKWGGKEINLENELSFKFDFSLRDDYTVNHSLDQDLVQDVRGMKTIRISPVIDYVVSERLRASIFYDYTRTVPRTSQSFPVTNQQGGLRINFTLN